MPVPAFSFIPALTFVWKEPAPKPVVAPKRPRAKRCPKPKPPKKGHGPLSPQVRSLLIDRLEAATSDGRLVLDLEGMARILEVLFPEEYLEPKRKARPAVTAPGSGARIGDYQDRVACKQGLYVAGDAKPGLIAGRGLKVESRRNGSGHKVIGWADEG